MTQFAARRNSRADSVGSVHDAEAVRHACPVRGAVPATALPDVSAELASLDGGALEERLGADPALLGRIDAELASLGATVEERVAYLQGRLTTLRSWIAESFGTEDVAESGESLALPPLRIKLTDERARSGSQSSVHAPGAKSPISQPGGKNPSQSGGKNPSQSGGKNPSQSAKANSFQSTKTNSSQSGKNSTSQSGKTLGTSIPRAGSGGASATGSKNLGRVMSKGPLGDGTLPGQTRGGAPAPSSQTPASVFWNYVEPYFKAIDEADLRVLEDAGRVADPTPYTLPALGRPYAQQWRELYGYDVATRRAVAVPGAPSVAVAPAPLTLRERLLAALVAETPCAAREVLGAEGDEPSENREGNARLTDAELAAVNARVRTGLRASGAADMLPCGADAREDDAVCAETRRLQRMLREQACVNAYRRRRVAAHVRSQLPAQEYYALLADVDRQVDAAFTRRVRILKKKKKGALALAGTSPAHVEPAALAETRRRLVDAFSGLLPAHAAHLLPAPPADVFRGADEAAAVAYARTTGAWLRVPEMPPAHVSLGRMCALPAFPARTHVPEGGPCADSPLVFEHPSVIDG